MPCVGLQCPKCQEKVPLERAVEHIGLKCRVLYPAAVQAIVDGVGDERRAAGAGLSPSVLSPLSNCPRQLAIQRYVDYYLDPYTLLDAEEGTLFHAAFHKRGRGADWFDVETPLPGPQHLGRPDVRENPKSGFPELLMWGSVWVSGVVDWHLRDWKLMLDLKTKRAAKTMYPPGADQHFQVNLYAEMAEQLGYGPIEELGIWVHQRGCYEKAQMQRYFPVERWGGEKVELHARAYGSQLQEWLDELDHVDDPKVTLKKIPMVGFLTKMFNGTKCEKYCECKSECFRLAGMVSF